MKFALINGQRCEAQPKLSGQCPSCGKEMVAKCGRVKTPHWAHKGCLACDPWWENETDWHRSWKSQFPESWQEVVHQSERGEKHIADVKTENGWVIEFQHSHIKLEERESRESFYSKLVWVIDGSRRSRDLEKLKSALEYGTQIYIGAKVWRVKTSDSTLFREWSISRANVLFDFGVDMPLWLQISGFPNNCLYLAQYSREAFVNTHRNFAAPQMEKFENSLARFRKMAEDDQKQLHAPRISGDPLLSIQNARSRLRPIGWGRRR